MKHSMIFSLATCSFAVLLSSAAMAQTNVPPPAQPAISDRSVVVPPAPAPLRPDIPNRPERPAVPGKPVPSKDMKDLVRDFQSARESFRKQQLELNRQLKAASEEQRALIRQQIQENLDQWREEQRTRIEDLREQAQQMKDEVRGLRDVIDSGANPNPGDGRPRR